MYILLTGTKKNAGDFLIAHAAKRLFEKYAPIPEYAELPSWKPVTDKLDLVNSSKALVLCGGPAYQRAIGSVIYPILKDLDKIKVPIISFGLGWKGIPGDDYDVEHYSFPESTKPLFDRLRNDFAYVGCRDYLTWRVLRRYGLDNALMTGCPAWYDPDYFGKELAVPDTVSRIIYTPAEQPVFKNQSVEICRTIRSLFPKAEIVCSFHRGWEADEYTKPENAACANTIRQEAKRMGIDSWDASGSVATIEKYKDFDLHIGYRVHGHLKFLSMRKPSFLITEDGRGRGVLEAMGLAGVSGMVARSLTKPIRKYVPGGIPRKCVQRIIRPYVVNENASDNLRDLIIDELNNDFARYYGALSVIDVTWGKMSRLLQALPR